MLARQPLRFLGAVNFAPLTKTDFSDKYSASFGQTVSYIARHLWPKDYKSKAQVVATYSAIFGSKWCGLQAPQVLGSLTNTLLDFKKAGEADSEKSRTIISLLGRYAMLQCGSALLEEVRSSIFSSVTARATQKAAEEAFEHLQVVDLDFLMKSKVSELGPVVERSSQALASMMSNSVLRLSSMIVEFGLLQRRLKKKHGDLGFISAATLASYFLFTILYSERRVLHRLANTRAQTVLRGNAQESLSNAETVRMLLTKDKEIDRYRVMHDEVTSTKKLVGHSLARLNAGQKLIMTVGASVAMWIRGEQVFMGRAKPGDIVSINQTFQQIARPLHYLGTMYREFKVDYQEIRSLLRILNAPQSIRDAPDAKPLVVNKGSIQVDNLSFTYPNGKKAISDVSFEIAGGSSVGIVGPSGSGKSTLIKLLARLYDPASGAISICNQKIKNVTLKSLRSAIGVIPQETILFDDTLAYNLLYGIKDTNINEDELFHAIKAAQLENVILSLRDGLDSKVGLRGSKLSGGERQRVAIARTLLRGPKITVLDEATSSLDAHTEKNVISGIRVGKLSHLNHLFQRLQPHNTLVTVAHRLSSVRDCDVIFYMKDGSIAESGTHNQLMEKNGLYAALWHDQHSRKPEASVKSQAIGDSSTAPISDCCHNC